MVFGLIAYDRLDAGAANQVLSVVVVTVTLSVVAHGLTSGPLAARYGRFAATLVDHRPEHDATVPFRTRPPLEFHTPGAVSTGKAGTDGAPD